MILQNHVPNLPLLMRNKRPLFDFKLHLTEKPHLRQYIIDPESSAVELVQSWRAGLIARPILLKLVEVLRQVGPRLVPDHARVVSVSGGRINVHLSA